MPMTYQTIQFNVADGVARLTLSRPDKLNAFTPEMHGEIRNAIGRLVAPGSGVRVLLLTGAGRAFCAGQDLTQRRGAAIPDLGHTVETYFNPLIRSLRAVPIPVIAAVNGVAAGAGMALALACDVVIAARSATFIQAFARIGLVPDSGASFFLPRLAGMARAMGLAMLADKISAEQAADWGLIWKVVDDDKLTLEADGLARQLARGPTKAYAMIKQLLNQSLDNTLDRQLDLERDFQSDAGKSEDYREGVAAFFDKRPANFAGR